MIKFIFCIISLIFWDPKQANKCLLYKTQGEFTGNSKVVGMQRNYKVCVAYPFKEVVGFKSTFIITDAFKEAISEIENYWYDD